VTDAPTVDPFLRPGDGGRPPRGGRWLWITGAVLVVISLIVGAVSLVHLGNLGSGVGRPFLDAITTPSRLTPVDEQMPLKAGTYVVFELTGHVRKNGPITLTTRDAPLVTTNTVTVQAPDGTRCAVTGGRGMSQTITRGPDLYTGVLQVQIPADGAYHVQLDTRDHAVRSVILAPSLTSGLGEAASGALGLGLAGLLLAAGLVVLLIGLLRRRPSRVAAPSPGHPQTGYPQTGYPQTGYPQTGYPQTGYPHAGYQQTSHPAPVTAPPPGWYPSPWGQGHAYWDGARWHTSASGPGGS